MTETKIDHPTADAWKSIARDPGYAHFVSIPERIIHCLNHFNIEADTTEIRQKLRAYYLFIGVTDEAIDSGELEMGEQILAHFRDEVFDLDLRAPRLCVVIDTLKQNIKREIHSEFMAKLDELYRTVVREHKATTINAYIQQRRIVGSLTAELSYLLIRPCLKRDEQKLLRFLRSVGAVGCLVDSVIDLRSDARRALISFKATASAFAMLLIRTLGEGLRITLRHPLLISLFVEAVVDNVRDRFRTTSRPAPRLVNSAEKEGVPSVVV